jgi:hypothetical protein
MGILFTILGKIEFLFYKFRRNFLKSSMYRIRKGGKIE